MILFLKSSSDGHTHDWTPPTSVKVQDCDVLTCWHVRIRMTQKTSFSRVLLSRKHQQFFRNLSWSLKSEVVWGSENHDLQVLPWQKRSWPTYHSFLPPLSRVVEGTPGRSVNRSRWSDRTSCTRPSGLTRSPCLSYPVGYIVSVSPPVVG